ncbi:PHD finger protein 24-like isoform X1 [Branchiostoma floridae]|nr:PHD finger protein 24-like isoform X1 [Branchiostoma floridae]
MASHHPNSDRPSLEKWQRVVRFTRMAHALKPPDKSGLPVPEVRVCAFTTWSVRRRNSVEGANNAFNKSSVGGGKVFSLSGQRRKPYVPRDEEYYTIMYDEEPRITTDVTCTICKGFERSAKIQCRVCGRNCHTNCFERRYRGDEQAMEASKRADTEAGWTCADCENLGQLLDEYETSMLMDKFDEYDSDQSTQITVEEYIEFQKDLCLESEGIEMSKEREEEERELFGNIDISGDGAINWWEFLTAKSIHFLNKKPKSYVLKQLTPREIKRIRDIFKANDMSYHGVLDREEAVKVMKEWMNSVGLESPDGDYSKYLLTSSCVIPWDTFIREHAVTIIAARINNVGKQHFLPVKRKS